MAVIPNDLVMSKPSEEAKYIEVSSPTGFKTVREFNGKMYVPYSEAFCETCAAVGGYCGHCSGHHWHEVYNLPFDQYPNGCCVFCGESEVSCRCN